MEPARVCLVLLCAAGPILGQTEVVERHESGRVHLRYTVDAQGRREGLFQEYDAEGTLRVEATYHQDRLHGRYRAFHANGKRRLWANYRDGKLNGRHTTFRGDGRKHIVAHYHDDLLHGKYEAVYANGQLKERASYKHAKLHGSFESFFENGRPRISATFCEGKRHGKYQEFDEDQTRTVTEHFHHGIRHGAYQVLERGSLVVDQVWEMGRIQKIQGVVAYPVPADDIRRELRRILGLPAAVEPKTPPAPSPAPSPFAKTPATPEAAAAVQRELDTPESALCRLQAYRFLCRVPYKDLRLDPGLCEHCANGARLCERIGRIAHEPERPADMDSSEYQRGFIGTKNSNLDEGSSSLAAAVDSFMEDAGDNNLAHVGHRRWCLNPPMRRTGFGKSGKYHAMWALDTSGPEVKQGEICYPPSGYVPIGFFGPDYLWSVMLMSGRKLVPSRIRVRVYALSDDYLRAGDDLPIKDLRVSAEGPGSCIIFRPLLLKVTPGRRYWAEISVDGGNTTVIRYLVEFMAGVR